MSLGLIFLWLSTEQGAGKEKLQAIKTILKVFAGREDDKLSDSIYEKFINYLTDAYETLDVLPQPDTLDLFKELKQRGIFIALNTGYNKETAEN